MNAVLHFYYTQHGTWCVYSCLLLLLLLLTVLHSFSSSNRGRWEKQDSRLCSRSKTNSGLAYYTMNWTVLNSLSISLPKSWLMVVLCCAVLAREEIQATYTTRWNGLGEAERPRWWRWGGWRWRMGGYVIGLCRALSSVDDNNNIVVAFCSALCDLYYILYTRESQLWVQKKMWDNIHNYTTVSLHYSAATNEPLPVKVIRLLSSFTLWAWAELRTANEEWTTYSRTYCDL